MKLRTLRFTTFMTALRTTIQPSIFRAIIVAFISLGSSLRAAPEAKPADQENTKASKSFQMMAKAQVQKLQADKKFEGFRTKVFIARPFVILTTIDPKATDEENQQRSKRLGDLAKGIWRNWLPIRKEWNLKSTLEDTIAEPAPLVWISFHSQEAYQLYLKNNKSKRSKGSRGFYNSVSKEVFTCEDPNRDPSIILIHETLHQLMDRFSVKSSTQYKNLCFTEGVPEYCAGHEGEGESLTFGKLNRPRRANEIIRAHTTFGDSKNVCYPNVNRRLQITPDDWILYDIPMLLTFRDTTWTRAIADALVTHFERSGYMKTQKGKDFVKAGSLRFYSAFYAFSWAFTYWLKNNYPEDYKTYASMVLNTERGGDAEVFLEAFNITPIQPLPAIEPILGPKNRDVRANMKQAVACLDKRIAILRQTPKIKAMHRQWADWMRITFPKKTTKGSTNTKPQ